MKFTPFLHKCSNPLCEGSLDFARVNLDSCTLVSVDDVEVWRSMLIMKHRDYDSKKSAYFRHSEILPCLRIARR